MNMTKATMFFQDLFYFPKLSSGMISVWNRNYTFFKNTLLISLFWLILEPFLYFIGIGYGLGSLVGNLQGAPYVVYYLPALMAISGFTVSFYESSYSSYTKLSVSKTYSSILLTPVTAVDIVMAEILWGAAKGFLSVLVVAGIGLVGGFISIQFLPLALAILFMLCVVSSSFGVLMASYAKNYNWFVYVQSGMIIPMTLFCATYFPISKLPIFIEQVIYVLPLTQAVVSTRALLNESINSDIFISLAALFTYLVFITNLAISNMERRLKRN